MTEMRRNIDLAASTGRHQAVLFAITSLGLGFSNEGAVLFNTTEGRTPLYAFNAHVEITPGTFDRLAGAASDEEAYLQILVDEGVLRKLSSPSAEAGKLPPSG